MNKFFVDELLERLETLSDTVNVTDQTSLKSTIILYGCQDRFPMVCNEYTLNEFLELFLRPDRDLVPLFVQDIEILVPDCTFCCQDGIKDNP